MSNTDRFHSLMELTFVGGGEQARELKKDNCDLMDVNKVRTEASVQRLIILNVSFTEGPFERKPQTA